MSEQRHDSVDVSYITFFLYLEKVTGFRKEAFTTVGLKTRLKVICKRFLALHVCGDILQKVLEIAKILSDPNKTCIEKGETTIVKFVDVLEKVANFLFTTFLGNVVVVITASRTNTMAGFIISLYYLLFFLHDRFSHNWFDKLQQFLISYQNSENFLKFFGCLESKTLTIQ